ECRLTRAVKFLQIAGPEWFARLALAHLEPGRGPARDFAVQAGSASDRLRADGRAAGERDQARLPAARQPASARARARAPARDLAHDAAPGPDGAHTERAGHHSARPQRRHV